MHYGITLPVMGADSDAVAVVELACLAEETGWDGVFLEDYILTGDNVTMYDPWVLLAAIAVRTKRIRIGTTVTPFSRRRPWKVARESVTLDHLSQGRLILGFGLGDEGDRSFTSFGEVTDMKQRARMVEEELAILTGLWTGEPFSFEGEYYSISNVTFLPKPVQTPRIPIWIGGFWPRKRPARRAARWDGFCIAKVHEDGSYGEVTLDDLRDIKTFIEQERAQSNINAPFDYVVGGMTPGDKPEQARAEVQPYAEADLNWWMEFVGTDARALRTRIEQGPPKV